MTSPTVSLMLNGDAARAIFAEIEDLPVYDIHTHVDLPMVLANEPAPDPWTALCGGDHYVASIIESLGAMNRREFYASDTDPYAKWQAYARIFPDLIGNQVRDWMRMTLRDLGIDKPFNARNARAIWDQLNETLRTKRWRPVDLFKQTNIHLMSTTNSPTDSLAEHEQAAGVFGDDYWMPAWRPDALFNLRPSPMQPKGWIEHLADLEELAGASLKENFKNFREALAGRHQHFADHGCRASDYGMAVPHGHDVDEGRATEVFNRASRGLTISPDEAADFHAYMLRFSMDLDYRKGWVSQIHYGPVRDQRELARELGGPDSGCDTVGGCADVARTLHDLLNHFDRPAGRHHRILIYSLDKRDWPVIAGLSRIYPSVYTGVAWWYFDSVSGMLEFFRTLPDIGAGLRKIGPFVTDARNIYSLVPRTQVYRRCLATVLGEMVEYRGDPLDDAVRLAQYLCAKHPLKILGK